ncbi:MAG: M15 family metallopeptidase [Lachnospiraceae bacterium]|nr:M15 family metallopeptidase [Lachnospiraceae bacterium]
MKEKKKWIIITAAGVILLAFVGTLVGSYISMHGQMNTALASYDEEHEKVEKLKQQLENKKAADKKAEEEATAAREAAAQAELDALEAALPPVDEIAVGTVLTDPQKTAVNRDEYFKSYEIAQGDPVYNRINGKSYDENGTVALSSLRYLKLLHYNFDHQLQVGELIVNASLADEFLQIFKELYDAGYEIQSMTLIDNYWSGDGEASDNASILVNNTSAFCYRVVTGGSTLSNHAYGCAIDINPQQNPYIYSDESGNLTCYHENAREYIARDTGLAHVITQEDVCCQIFKNHGFSWGGDWGTPIDYQHFEKAV